MNEYPSSAKSKPQRRESGPRWPMLAQLPDVADQGAPVSTSTKREPAEFVPHRFDPPQPHAAAGEQKTISPRLRPHVVKSIPRTASSILPRSNPFALPAPSVRDRLAPFAPFLILLVIVTVTGIPLVIIGQRRDSAKTPGAPRNPAQTTREAGGDHSPPIAAPRLTAEPATTAGNPLEETAAPKSSMTAPTATGPLGTHQESETPVARQPDTSSRGPTHAAALKSEVSSAISQPELLGADGGPLPQVQTSDDLGNADTQLKQNGDTAAARSDGLPGPPAVARLNGCVLPMPAR